MTSHESSTIVTEHIKLLDEVCRAKDSLTVTRGKPHEHLKMTIKFSLERGVATTHYDFTKKLWMTLPPYLKENYRIRQKPDLLFKVDKVTPLLNYTRKDKYHTNAEKMLWMNLRSRPYLQLSTGPHCTRVKSPTAQDWCKLKHMMG